MEQEKKKEEEKREKEIIKNNIYKKIKLKIIQNKIYPKKAIRRKKEGDVEVKFTVSKDGKLLDIVILNGRKIFYRSVKSAIKNSFPIKIDKNIFDKNFELNLVMHYRFNF